MSGTSITKAHRHDFAKEQVQLIKRTVAKDCDDNELVFFLEVAAAHELNPLTGEIYAAKLPGKNGDRGRVVILVGRNGWLKIARRHTPQTNPYDYFTGLDGDVVRENDTFRVRRGQGGRIIEHEYGSLKDRGAIIGAWATVSRVNQEPVYFFAPLNEYRPTSEAKLRFSPWGAQESVMILKCAQVAALRLAFNISGVYDEAEMARMTVQEEPSGPEVDYGEDALGDHLRALVHAANEIDDSFFRPAKLAMLLNGKTVEERTAVADELEAFITSHGGEVPEPVIDVEAVQVP